MKLIVGLGNPGSKYERTRHNVGFDVVDRMAADAGGGRWKERFSGRVQDVRIDGTPALLLKPLTYMNLSGQAVQAACRFYKLEPADVLVICDDFHLPLGKLRFRARGSAGGQKGLADILNKLQTQEVPRLRIGVGELPDRWDAADFVLSRFAKDEQPIIELALDRAAQAAGDWVRSGIEYCMNHYNAG